MKRAVSIPNYDGKRSRLRNQDFRTHRFPSESQRQRNGDKRMKVVPVLFLCPHSIVHYPAPEARGYPVPSKTACGYLARNTA